MAKGVHLCHMRVITLSLLALFLLAGCDERTPEELSTPKPGGRWTDPRMQAVLEAQDHRRTADLCAMLKDSSAAVREATALALASLQDSSARPFLLATLLDRDATVRGAAGFALAGVADSSLLAALQDAADKELDPTVRAQLTRAVFAAELRSVRHDPTWYLSFLESTDRAIRLRAAQTLARLPREALVSTAASVLHAVHVERDPAVRQFLVASLKHHASRTVTDSLRRLAAHDSMPQVRIAAVRALGAKEDTLLAPLLLDRAILDADPGVRQTAVEQLQRYHQHLDGEAIWKAAQETADYRVKLPLYGLVLKHAGPGTRVICRMLMESMRRQDLGPYLNAALLTALGPTLPQDTLLAMVLGDRPAVERQAALTASMAQFQEKLKAGEIRPEQRDQWLVGQLRQVLASEDAGLIAAVCDRLAEERPEFLRQLLTGSVVARVREALHPVRDLETLQLLDQALARRDGREPPVHAAPPFNHPIDRARLGLLRDGQRYRIVTAKGTIVLALEPATAPGSCAAFDSLATAGYYNGRYFHRIVPNFVAQGGCPRGDGYGGMPWTLRTEVAPEGFVEGAVGLASAGRDTESCQFFIMLAPAPHLDGRYTRFARVVSGLEVARRLEVGDVMTKVERVR